jgi:uncharacterized protein
MSKTVNSVLIKPAGPDCNLACQYCFYLEKAGLFPESKHHRMSDEILKETVKQVMQQGGQNISFGWQGGEPTLMGRDFFERAIQYQARFGSKGQVVGNGLQTNGWLIDKDWAGLLHDANFLVGLSLDGPEYIHDRYRRTASNQGTWQRVAQARDVMLESGVEVNALIVVNDYSVRYPKEIYEYHKRNGLVYQQYIPCMEPDPQQPDRPISYAVPPEHYGAFLCTLFDLWMSDFRFGKPTTFVRWFDSLFYTYVDMSAPECTLLPECGVYVVVEHNGDVYSCDFFVDPEWRLGNIMQDPLHEMLNSPRQNEFGCAKSQLHERCQVCPWRLHCHGGCPKDRKVSRDGLDPLCPAYETFFAYADGKFKKLAYDWKVEQGIIKPGDTAKQDWPGVNRNDSCPCGSGKKYKNCCMP